MKLGFMMKQAFRQLRDRWQQLWSKLCMSLQRRLLKFLSIAICIGCAVLLGHGASAQLSTGLQPLSTVPVPGPSAAALSRFVRDRSVLLALGKALFWDMNVGSDQRMSCASCHFHAGADNRSKNQVSPGLLGGDITFQLSPVNAQLMISQFPLRKLSNPDDRTSAVKSDTNDVVSSQGVHLTQFNSDGSSTPLADSVFQVGGKTTRRVEPRNSPTVINAVFNHRNFWDGRASNVFNGVNPFGDLDQNANLWENTSANTLQAAKVNLPDSSLASQAVGPPLSFFEMSAQDRSFPDIGRLFTKKGRKILRLRPLGQQLVHPEDSVLGGTNNLYPKPGLAVSSYSELIKKAFQPQWWNNNSQMVSIDGTDYTQLEANFSLFFGLAVQEYERSLVSDQTPFDQYLAGKSALSNNQKAGLNIFLDKGKCINCHGGAELTNASVQNVRKQPIERMTMGDGGTAVYDNGFYNVGVRPTKEDLAVGSNIQLNGQTVPLSLTKQAQINGTISASERTAVNGAFKTPSLRNVELTAPYFHNGDAATLGQVVQFYNRGGNFGLGVQPINNSADLDPDIQSLKLTKTEQSNLVEFLKSLTDQRVRYERAPFDHPQLFVPNGHIGNTQAVQDANGDGQADDAMIEIPPVGSRGRLQPPKNFLE
jgi:cytochrome c peroxidase